MTSWTQQGVVVPAPQASRGCHHCLGANGGSEGLQDALEKCLLGPGVGGGLAAPFNQPRSLTGPRKKKKIGTLEECKRPSGPHHPTMT